MITDKETIDAINEENKKLMEKVTQADEKIRKLTNKLANCVTLESAEQSLRNQEREMKEKIEKLKEKIQNHNFSYQANYLIQPSLIIFIDEILNSENNNQSFSAEEQDLQKSNIGKVDSLRDNDFATTSADNHTEPEGVEVSESFNKDGFRGTQTSDSEVKSENSEEVKEVEK